MDLASLVEPLAVACHDVRLGRVEEGDFALALDAAGRGEATPEQMALVRTRPLFNSLTRTTCVATMLSAGHAENALPQSATATVNCRIFCGLRSGIWAKSKSASSLMTGKRAALIRCCCRLRSAFRQGQMRQIWLPAREETQTVRPHLGSTIGRHRFG